MNPLEILNADLAVARAALVTASDADISANDKAARVTYITAYVDYEAARAADITASAAAHAAASTITKDTP